MSDQPPEQVYEAPIGNTDLGGRMRVVYDPLFPNVVQVMFLANEHGRWSKPFELPRIAG